MNTCYESDIQQITRKLHAVREPGDLCFPLLTDTRLADRMEETVRNIRRVNEAVPFDCLVHLGDVLTGNTPENASARILSRELAMFQEAVPGKPLFVTAGENDGFRNERFVGQMVHGIFTNEWWYRATAGVCGEIRTVRPGNKPYYYTDAPEKKLRLVFLYAYTVQLDQKLGLFDKTVGFDAAQLGWLAEKALAAPAGWTVLLFSHCLPKSRLETGKEPFVYKGHATEQVLSLLQKAQGRGVSVGCWFAGHYGLDELTTVAGIPVCVTDGAAAGECWDAVVVKPRDKKICLFRFGAGEDRVVEYK